jgi:hypothetical protein
LIHPHGLTSHEYPYLHRASKGGLASLEEANLLIHICLQVDAETRGRALQLNNLIFRSNVGKTGLSTFLGFHTLLNASPRAPEKIDIFVNEHITAGMAMGWNATFIRFIRMLKQPAFLSLKTFASQHPTTRIIVYLSVQEKDFLELYMRYEALHRVLRGSSVSDIQALSTTAVRLWIRALVDVNITDIASKLRNDLIHAEADFTLPNNLRFLFDLGLGWVDEDSSDPDATCDEEFGLVERLYSGGC